MRVLRLAPADVQFQEFVDALKFLISMGGAHRGESRLQQLQSILGQELVGMQDHLEDMRRYLCSLGRLTQGWSLPESLEVHLHRFLFAAELLQDSAFVQPHIREYGL